MFKKINIFLHNQAPLFITAGVLLLAGINMQTMLSLPKNLTKLYYNPVNVQIIQNIARNTTNKSLKNQIIEYLKTIGRPDITLAINADKIKIQRKIKEIKKITGLYPNYPDAYAYLTVIYLKQKKCAGAKRNIKRAQALDPNREEFALIKKQVLEICP